MSYQYKQTNYRTGMEKKLFDFFCKELGRNGGNAQNALDTLDYLVFIENKDKFYRLCLEDQMEIRFYVHALSLIHKVNR